MATFGEIQARVRTRVIDLPPTVAAEVPQLINDALRDLQKMNNYKVMERVFTAQTVAYQRALAGALPTDWKEYRGKPFVQDALGRGWWLDVTTGQANGDLAYGTDPDLDFGPPRVIGLNAPDDRGPTGLSVWPYPDGASLQADGEYTIVVPYWRWLDPLTSDASTNWFTENGSSALIERATQKAFEINWDEDRALYWGAKADKSENDLKLLNKRAYLSGGNTMAVTDGANAPMFRK